MRRVTLCLAALVLGITSWAPPAHAENFRMETDVFIGTNKEPVVQYLTLFTHDAIYDFRVTSPEEVTIVDLNRSRIVLLDSARKMKATLNTEEVLQYTASIKAQVNSSNPTFYFAANPNFEVSHDDATDWLTLSSEQLTYRIKGSKPKQADAVRRYQEFADWSARLSSTRPGNLPPYARMAVNRAIAEKEWLPDEVERTIPPARLGMRKLEMRTRHHVNWLLSETDRKRLDRVGTDLVSFKAVPYQEYRVDPAVNKQTKR